MNIVIATLREPFDPAGDGYLSVTIDKEGGTNQPVSVNPTSIFASGKGIIKAPSMVRGTRILIVKPENDSEYYFLTATFKKGVENEGPKDALNNAVGRAFLTGDRTTTIAQGSGRDNSLLLQNQAGVGLEMNHIFNKKFRSKYIKMFTPSGKRVILQDSPTIDSIVIDTGKDSYLALTGDTEMVTKPKRGLEAKTNGTQRFTSTAGSIDISVKEGQDLSISNHSFGFRPPITNPLRTGNVNIQSDWGDVNIMQSVSPAGKIFLECQNVAGGDQLIQLRTAPTPVNKIKLSTGTVEIDATTININAIDSINLNATGAINLLGGIINMRALTTVNIDGITGLFLNSGTANIPPSTPTPPVVNKYPLGIEK